MFKGLPPALGQTTSTGELAVHDECKLIDYTIQGRRDLPCICSLKKRQSSSSSDQQDSSVAEVTAKSSMNRAASWNQLSSATSTRLTSSSLDSSDKESHVEFFLKIPSRRRSQSLSEKSRKDLLLACSLHSLMPSRRSSSNFRSLIRKEERGSSVIDRVLRHECPNVSAAERKHKRTRRYRESSMRANS